jgi:hypothetical protein
MILIRNGTPLPPDLLLETEIFVPGWNAVRKLDGYGLGRRMHQLNWNFFHLAGEIRVTVLGRDGDSAVRKAVGRLLAKLKNRKFNSLEITKVVSRRIFGLPFVNVAARCRHIQQSIALISAEEAALKTAADGPGSGAGSSGEQRHAAAAAKRYAALISNS